ncbi:DUF4231 domain-containing protein [Kovacikia minuta]|uniref:DUF4231 domain-containing protein n=1 Tax=Kovacikia minuta TaxID=2931930 RepID=UPI0020C7A0D4|nr:DUF4231 domain-containing protein [Kovacikia minuta]
MGVAPVGKVALIDTPFLPSEGTALEPNHTHFVFAPGNKWGDESPWLTTIATTLAGDRRSLTLLINGGEIALVEVVESVKAGRPVVVIAGSGRLADEIATAIRSPEQLPRDEIQALVQSGQFIVFDISNPLTALTNLLRQGLSSIDLPPEAADKIEPIQPNFGLLKKAWERQQTYSKNASAAQSRFNRLRLCILGFSVLATVLAILQKNRYNDPSTPIDLLGFCLIIVPIITSILLAGSVKFDKGNNWILLRGSAEALKRELYYYRTRVGAYSKNRDAQLAYRLKVISERLKGSSVHQTCLNPYETEILNRTLVSRSDQAATHPLLTVDQPADQLELSPQEKKLRHDLADLNAETYMARRLEDQFDRYRSKAKELNSQLYVLQWGIYIFGGIGTLLAAVKLGAWVAVTISLTSVFSSFLEFKRIEETLISYNQAADSLYDIRVLWDSLSDQEKNKSENFELLVKTTEETIQRENESWLQNMQDSLVEFYKKIDKTPGNKPETEN